MPSGGFFDGPSKVQEPRVCSTSHDCSGGLSCSSSLLPPGPEQEVGVEALQSEPGKWRALYSIRRRGQGYSPSQATRALGELHFARQPCVPKKTSTMFLACVLHQGHASSLNHMETSSGVTRNECAVHPGLAGLRLFHSCSMTVS